MASQPTTINVLNGPGFAARIADLFPRGWCSDDAKQSGNVYALFLTFGQQISFLQGALAYALDAQRIDTATFPEIDEASEDFFGNALPRPAGLDDADYAKLIIASLFRPTATRAAITSGLATLTGYQPRLMEPWNVLDTGAWSDQSYWDIDTSANPARWGDGSQRYTGYIEVPPPVIPAIGPHNPVLTYDDSAFWDQPGYFFGTIQSTDVNAVDNLINQLRAFGTTIWVKLVPPSATTVTPPAVAPGLAGNVTATPAGNDRVLVTWTPPAIGTPPLTYTVLYRQSGTTAWTPGPVVTASSATVLNLASGVPYDFQIVTRNSAGFSTSGTASAAPNKTPPSPATGLTATQVQATAVTLAWQAPTTGTPPFTYSVNYRPTGTTAWQSMIVGQGSLTVTVINLTPSTSYDFEVVTTNL